MNEQTETIEPGAVNGNQAPIIPSGGGVPSPFMGGGIHNAAIAAAQAQAMAEVQARYIMARANPRNTMVARQMLLSECERPAFADKAIYERPVGKKKDERTGKWVDELAVGLSIRFAEAALQAWGNLMVNTSVIYDSEDARVLRTVAMDLERNTYISLERTVLKTVERKKPRKGDVVLSSRQNSYGDTVFTIRADEIAFAPKEGAVVSKMMREVVLRSLPADLKQAAIDHIRATRSERDKKDPKAAVLRIVDGMGRLNIPANEIEEYLGHKLETVSPAEVDDLRNIYSRVSDGDAAWSEILRDRLDDRATEEAKPRVKSTDGDATGGKKSPLARGAAASAKPSGSADPAPKTEQPAAAQAEASPDPLPANDFPDDEDTRADYLGAIEGMTKTPKTAGLINAALATAKASSIEGLTANQLADLYQVLKKAGA